MNTQGDSRSRQATAVRGKTNMRSQPDALLTVWDLVTCIHVDLVPDVFRAGIVFFKAVGKLWARRFYRRLCSRGNIVFCNPQCANLWLSVTHAESDISDVDPSVRSLQAGSDPGGKNDATQFVRKAVKQYAAETGCRPRRRIDQKPDRGRVGSARHVCCCDRDLVSVRSGL